jgi:hypothetical protein
VASKPTRTKDKETPQRVAARSRKLRNGAPGAVVLRKGGTVGGGRALGQQNRLSRNAKEALELAFQGTGGVTELIKWGKKNRTEFYKLWGRLIPKDVQVGASEGLEDLLARLAEQQSNSDVVPAEYTDIEAESR